MMPNLTRRDVMLEAIAEFAETPGIGVPLLMLAGATDVDMTPEEARVEMDAAATDGLVITFDDGKSWALTMDGWESL